MSWIDEINDDHQVIICKHVVVGTAELTCVYHAEDGTISMLCDAEHDMVHGTDVTWTHARHLIEHFPHLATLPTVPLGSMGYYFSEHEIWVVEAMLEAQIDE